MMMMIGKKAASKAENGNESRKRRKSASKIMAKMANIWENNMA
jgi:hypothetical protein